MLNFKTTLRNKKLYSQVREIISNVLNYFENEKTQSKYLNLKLSPGSHIR